MNNVRFPCVIANNVLSNDSLLQGNQNIRDWFWPIACVDFEQWTKIIYSWRLIHVGVDVIATMLLLTSMLVLMRFVNVLATYWCLFSCWCRRRYTLYKAEKLGYDLCWCHDNYLVVNTCITLAPRIHRMIRWKKWEKRFQLYFSLVLLY